MASIDSQMRDHRNPTYPAAPETSTVCSGLRLHSLVAPAQAVRPLRPKMPSQIHSDIPGIALKSDVSEPFRCPRANDGGFHHSRRFAIDPSFAHDEILLPDKHASHPLPHVPPIRLADEDLPDPERPDRIPLLDRIDIKPALIVSAMCLCVRSLEGMRRHRGRTGSVLPSIQHRWAGSLPNASIFRRTSPSLSSVRGRPSRLNVSAWTSPIGGLARTMVCVVLGTGEVMLQVAVCSNRRMHEDCLGV